MAKQERIIESPAQKRTSGELASRPTAEDMRALWECANNDTGLDMEIARRFYLWNRSELGE